MMHKRVLSLLIAVAVMLVVSGCGGHVADQYTNEKDPGQKLELVTLQREGLHAIAARIHHSSDEGEFTLFKDEKATTGSFVKKDDKYILSLVEGKQLKLSMQAGGGLVDENGNRWKLETHSMSLRKIGS